MHRADCRQLTLNAALVFRKQRLQPQLQRVVKADFIRVALFGSLGERALEGNSEAA